MYFGSVRFFKHLILGFLVLLIAVPVTVCVQLGVQNHTYRQQLGLTGSGEGEPGMRASAAELERPLPSVEPSPMAEEPAYQALYPALYAAPARHGVVDTDKTLYLTFDGGPSALTPKVLETLARYDVKATFFATGREDEQSKQWLADMAAAGHTVGVHTYSHDYRTIYASVERYLEDFDKTYRLIFEATGAYPQVFRFPGGSVNGYNGGIYRDLIAEMARRGFVYFDWTVNTADTAATTPDAVARQALTGTESRRAVVLLHNDGDAAATLNALPAIIEGYQAAGFTFAPLTPQVRQVALG